MTVRAAHLWLVRHAPVLAAPGLCYGQLDLPADPQATRACAQALASLLPTGIRMHHSPLQRCEQLNQCIQAVRPDLSSNSDPRLRELNFGSWEGRPWNDLPRAEIDAWAAGLADCAPGGGEPLAHMLNRVAAALADARAHATQTGQDVVWITHAGVARCVQWLQQRPTGALPSAHEWPAHAPAPGAWVCHPLGG